MSDNDKNTEANASDNAANKDVSASSTSDTQNTQAPASVEISGQTTNEEHEQVNREEERMDASKESKSPEELELSKDNNTQAQSNRKPKTPKSAKTSSGRLGKIFVSFIFIVLCTAIAAGAYVTWYGIGLVKEQKQEIDALKTELDTTLSSVRQQQDKKMADARADQLAAHQRLENKSRELDTIIGDLDKRIIAQNKRLRSMSTTSREDWLLAEAEYLLKLANQRVLIEKNAEGAAALLAEADAILRDLSDPDLFAIRREVKSDLAELRLTEKIDTEGIYLSLVALAGKVEKLPLHPTFQQRVESMADNDTRVKELTTLDDIPWYKKPVVWISQLGSTLGGYFEVYEFEEKPKPLLPPEQSAYLQQNLRMMLERAQLALLREQSDVYRQSLEQTRAWVERYYPRSKIMEAFVEEIKKLEQENIIRGMPDITGSLELLQNYIIDLHKVGDAKPAAREQ